MSTDANRRAGAPRAAAARGGEQLAGGGVDRRAGLELAVDERGDRHGVPRHAVEEVRRAVERIGDEDEPARAAHVGRALLGEQRRVRMPAGDQLGDRRLARAIDLADEVVGALGLPHEGGAPVRALAHDVGAARRRGDACREQRARIRATERRARGADAVLHSLRRVRRAHYVRGMARIFSGIQPSGELHIGNYLGAVKNWVALQHTAESIFCIVDYHAIIAAYEPAASSRPPTRDGARAARRGNRSVSVHAVRPVGRAGTYRAGVDLQHRHAARRARTTDAVQGQVAADGERERRAAQLSHPAGGGHPAVSRRSRAGGRGSGAAPRAVARDRTSVEREFAPDDDVLPRAAAGAHADAAHHGTRRPVEDVEVDGEHDRAARVAARRSGRSSDPR